MSLFKKKAINTNSQSNIKKQSKCYEGGNNHNYEIIYDYIKESSAYNGMAGSTTVNIKKDYLCLMCVWCGDIKNISKKFADKIIIKKGETNNESI